LPAGVARTHDEGFGLPTGGESHMSQLKRQAIE